MPRSPAGSGAWAGGEGAPVGRALTCAPVDCPSLGPVPEERSALFLCPSSTSAFLGVLDLGRHWGPRTHGALPRGTALGLLARGSLTGRLGSPRRVPGTSGGRGPVCALGDLRRLGCFHLEG